MTTKVAIISNILGVMGHEPITTLDEGDALTVAAEQAFDLKLPSVLCQNSWRFAVQIQQLSLTNETLPSFLPWKYVYLLPADFLKTIRTYPRNDDWDIFENRKIYANVSSEFYMEYVFQPDIELLPPYFTDYFVYEIASYLALSNAQKPDFYSVLKAERTLLLGIAAAADAQNRPNNASIDFPVLSNRAISGMINN